MKNTRVTTRKQMRFMVDILEKKKKKTKRTTRNTMRMVMIFTRGKPTGLTTRRKPTGKSLRE